MKKRGLIIIIFCLFTLAFLIRPPVVGGKVTSWYGPRISNGRYFHTGTDIGIPAGTPVNSISWGTIKETGFTGRNGNYVIVSHLPFIESRYLHLDSINAAVGQRLDHRTVIGRAGNTGISTGSHLHLEIRIWGIPLPAYTLCLPGLVVQRIKT